MFGFLKRDRKSVLQDEINHVTSKLTYGYSDIEVAEMVLAIKERALTFLKHRREHLSNELELNIESIKKLEE